METKVYERKTKGDKPILAICYDFDKTLSPDDMQSQGFIQSLGYNVVDFWTKSNELAERNDMDQNLAYMYTMISESEGRVLFNRKTLEEHGSKVKFFPGVETWFERIKEYGRKRGVIVEHYVISSGLKEMIEGTSIAKNGAFEKIYASSFYYNEQGAAKWPAQVVNYTNKTQFLFRIEKGTLDVNDPAVNDSFAPEQLRVPFRNMVYVGDSDTDIPCMKLVNSLGGHSIGVYNAAGNDKTKVYKMMRADRIKYFAPADYSEGSEMDVLVKAIIDRTASNEQLEGMYAVCKSETAEADKQSSEETRRKRELINALDCSGSFKQTHELIAEMSQYDSWTEEEREFLFEIATHNSQVFFIINDYIVKAFYTGLLEKTKNLKEDAKKIKEILEKK